MVNDHLAAGWFLDAVRLRATGNLYAAVMDERHALSLMTDARDMRATADDLREVPA